MPTIALRHKKMMYKASIIKIVLAISFPQVVRSFSFHPQSRIIVTQMPSMHHKLNVNSLKQDDDGWGDDNSNESADPFTENSRIAKSKELEQLQNDLNAKRSLENVNVSSVRSNGKDRDLFIPIFTLVAVIGFTSLYGYEMLRLYLRGELYLPWEQ